jgi:hypothetical protein
VNRPTVRILHYFAKSKRRMRYVSPETYVINLLCPIIIIVHVIADSNCVVIYPYVFSCSAIRFGRCKSLLIYYSPNLIFRCLITITLRVCIF